MASRPTEKAEVRPASLEDASDAEADSARSWPPLGYYGTVSARAMSRMAKEEILLRLQATDVNALTGKIFFKTHLPPGAPELREIRSVERLMIVTARKDIADCPTVSKDKEEALQQLSKVFVDETNWELYEQCWRSFHQTQETKGKEDAVEGEQKEKETVTFKVKVTRSGAATEHMASSEIAGRMGRLLLERHAHWKVDLKHGDLEVVIHVNEEQWCCGIAVLRQPLDNRGYIVHQGLHPTVAWALARAGGLQPGETVIDPMCGRGAVLVEAARSWPECTYFGLDNDPAQILCAKDNLAMAKLEQRVSLLDGDVTRMPLKDASVDVLLCDLPFGKQYGSVEGNKTLYPAVLEEAARIVRPGGRAVLLTSDHNGELMEQQVGEGGVQHKAGNWQLLASHPVKIGFKMPTHMYLIWRMTEESFREYQEDLKAGKPSTRTKIMEELGLRSSGWKVVAGMRSWRKRWVSERPAME